MKSDYFSKSRVEAFSDGIFAIIVTLLVLEIKVPEIHDHNSIRAVTNALISLLPKIFSWIVSFLIVSVIWVNHHRIFQQIKTITHALFWLNANLLLWCSFIPFPTALMGDYFKNPVSLILFGVILSLMASSFSMMRFSMLRNKEILHEDVDINEFKKATRKSILFGPILYLSGAALSLIHPYVSFCIFLVIPVYFIFFNSVKSSA